MIDRRVDTDPHPPEGVRERRYCSDPICEQAREDWLNKTVIPRIERRIYKSIIGAVGLCAGAFMFLSHVESTKLELKLKDTYESLQHHNSDVGRIEKMISDMQIITVNSQREILLRMDRILQRLNRESDE